MPGAVKVQRIEHNMAVQYIPGDKESESVIRGWTNIPLTVNLSEHIAPEAWLVRRFFEDKDGVEYDSQIYAISPSDFAADFVLVL